jgi:hypothetical protein
MRQWGGVCGWCLVEELVVEVDAAGGCRGASCARKVAVAGKRVNNRMWLRDGAMLRETAVFQEYGRDRGMQVEEGMRVNGMAPMLSGIAVLSYSRGW